MKNKLKKLIVVVLGVFIAFSFAACSSGVDVVESSDENNWYFSVRVKIDLTFNSALETGAAINGGTNQKWTVEGWLYDYFNLISGDREMTVEYTGKKAIEGSNNYIFNLKVPRGGKGSEIFELESTQTSTANLFLRTYSVERENRFNPFIEQFNDVYPRFKESKPLTTDYSSELGVVLLGKRTYYPNKGESDQGGEYIYDSYQKSCYTESLPAFNKAFPVVGDMSDYMNFALDNYWRASKHMKVPSGEQILQNDGSVYYFFHKTLGDAKSQIAYDFYRAVGAGWYLVSILAGCITVVVILLTAKIKRKRKKPQDTGNNSLPFDPFS